MFVVLSQLLSDLLAPVTDQVPEHISDHSNILSFRAHIKNSINTPSQVRAAPPLIVSSLKKQDTEGTLGFTMISLHPFPSLRPPVPACCHQTPVFPSLFLHLRGQRAVRSKGRESLRSGGWTTVSSSNGNGGAQRRRRRREERRGATITREPSLVSFWSLCTNMQSSNTRTLSPLAALVSYFLFDNLSTQSQQRRRIHWGLTSWTRQIWSVLFV